MRENLHTSVFIRLNRESYVVESSPYQLETQWALCETRESLSWAVSGPSLLFHLSVGSIHQWKATIPIPIQMSTTPEKASTIIGPEPAVSKRPIRAAAKETIAP